MYTYGICIRCHGPSPEGFYLCTEECEQAFKAEHQDMSFEQALLYIMYSIAPETSKPETISKRSKSKSAHLPIKEVERMRKSGLSYRAIAQRFGVSYETIRKVCL
jgi:DNA-binding transcriptional regulator YiaG